MCFSLDVEGVTVKIHSEAISNRAFSPFLTQIKPTPRFGPVQETVKRRLASL